MNEERRAELETQAGLTPEPTFEEAQAHNAYYDAALTTLLFRRTPADLITQGQQAVTSAAALMHQQNHPLSGAMSRLNAWLTLLIHAARTEGLDVPVKDGKVLLVSHFPIPQSHWEEIVQLARDTFDAQVLTVNDLVQEYPQLEALEGDLIEVRPACSDAQRLAFFEQARAKLPEWAEGGISLPHT